MRQIFLKNGGECFDCDEKILNITHLSTRLMPTDEQSYAHRSQSRPETYYFRSNKLVLYQRERGEGEKAQGPGERDLVRK